MEHFENLTLDFSDLSILQDSCITWISFQTLGIPQTLECQETQELSTPLELSRPSGFVQALESPDSWTLPIPRDFFRLSEHFRLFSRVQRFFGLSKFPHSWISPNFRNLFRTLWTFSVSRNSLDLRDPSRISPK